MKLLLAFLLLYTISFAAPAFNKTREFTQADGTIFKANANGDSYLNWIQTLDGEILKYNAQTKNYEYTIIKNDNLELSGVAYENNNLKKAKSFRSVDKLDMDDVYKIWQKRKNNKVK